jgi:hypothetical protein
VSGRAQAAALTLAATLCASSYVRAADALSGELARCAAIASAEARLGCYDVLAARSAQQIVTAVPATPAAAPPAPAPAAPAIVPVAPAAVATLAAPPAATPQAAPPAAANPAEVTKNFGLSSVQAHATAPEPSSIEAHVAQLTTDRFFRSYVVLDNGQTWKSTEGELQLLSGEAVTIKHAALGSFMLVSSLSKHSYHVRRVQ